MTLRASLQAGLLNQSSAQVIDGSLKFVTGDKTHFQRTFANGNRKKWSWSGWVKYTVKSGAHNLFAAYNGSSYAQDDFIQFYINGNSGRVSSYGSALLWSTEERLRDTGWYHIVFSFDSTQDVANDRLKIYINGVLSTKASGNGFTQNDDYAINNSANTHRIGTYNGTTEILDGNLTQVYFIDGQAVGPGYFGFTDPLTNTWRPRKVKTSGPNDGTTWSSVSTISSGGANGGNVLTNGFNGSTSGAFEGDTSGATVTVPISTNIIRGGVRVYAAVTSSNPLVVVIKNGDTTVETINAGSSGGKYYGSSTYSGAITSLVISRTGRAPEFNAIEINGTMLIDGDRTNFGSNGFYLPMDGNSPIGQDKSGIGNDFTPVNFGGSVSLDNPIVSGARPILNTTQGGTQAGVGYFGSKENKNITVTVASKTGGGNAYFFDGVERDSLEFFSGTTILFDTTDSSNDSHPFKLSSTNADSSGGTEYTDGVAYFVNGGQKNGTDYVNQYSSHSSGFRGIKWTVPHNVSTTYYYCTVHPGMGNNGR